MSRHLRTTLRLANVQGHRTLIVEPDIPDDAPEALREGIARRRIVNGGGTCPCGARVVLPNRAQRRAGVVTVAPVEHEPDCPAGDEVLRPVLAEWEATR